MCVTHVAEGVPVEVAGVCTRVSWRLMVALGPLLAFASAAVSICSILATCQHMLFSNSCTRVATMLCRFYTASSRACSFHRYSRAPICDLPVAGTRESSLAGKWLCRAVRPEARDWLNRACVQQPASLQAERVPCSPG